MRQVTAKHTVNGRTLIATLIEEAPSEAAIVLGTVCLLQVIWNKNSAKLLLRRVAIPLLIAPSNQSTSKHYGHRFCRDHGVAVRTVYSSFDC